MSEERAMIEELENVLDSMLEMDLTQITKFQCIEVLIAKLMEEGWYHENAIKVVCSMKLEVSDNAWNNHREDIERQLGKFAKLVEKLYAGCHYRFGMEVDDFILTFAKDLSYKMEI